MIKYYLPVYVFLLALLTSSCSDTSKYDKPVTIAISPWPGYAFALLAQDLGYLKYNNNNNIKFIVYQSLNDSRIAFENGNVDGMFSTMIEVIESTQEGKATPNIVLVTNFSNGPDQILAKKDIKNMHDIKGKKIGVEEASIGMYMLNRSLEINNIAFDELTLVQLPPNQMEKALEDNLIDSAVTYPPYTMKIKRLAPNILFHSGMIPNEIIDVLSIDEKIIRNNIEVIELLISGLSKAYTFYQKNPEKTDKILNKYPGFSDGNLNHSLKGLSVPEYKDQAMLLSPGGEIEKSINNIIITMNKQKLISQNFDTSKLTNKKILQLHSEINPMR